MEEYLIIRSTISRWETRLFPRLSNAVEKISVKWCGCVENWIPARGWKIKSAVLFCRQEAAGEFNKRVSSHILFSDFVLRPAFDVLKSCFNLWTFWQTANELFSLKRGASVEKFCIVVRPGFKGEIIFSSKMIIHDFNHTELNWLFNEIQWQYCLSLQGLRAFNKTDANAFQSEKMKFSRKIYSYFTDEKSKAGEKFTSTRGYSFFNPFNKKFSNATKWEN